MKGLPRFVLSRGHVAVTEGVMSSREGHGAFVAREPRGEVNRALSSWKALTAPRPRIATRPTLGSQRRRLAAKAQRGTVKALRGSVGLPEDG